MNSALSTLKLKDSIIDYVFAKLNGGLAYIVSSDILIDFNNLVIDYPMVYSNKGGGLYLKSTTGLTEMILNYVTVS
jgi:hypothetical protein